MPGVDSREPVTLTEVAELAGVLRASVSNWRRRHRDFPKPVRVDGQQPLFDADDLAKWLDRRPIPGARSRPLTYGDQFRDRLRMRTLTALRGLLPGDALIATAFALCALRHITGRPLGDVESVRTTAHEAERDGDPGLLIPDLGQLQSQSAALVATIDEMCSAIGAAGAVERLISEADRLGSGIRAQLTPTGVAEFVAELAGDVSRRVVYDPAAGSGTLLLRVASNGTPSRLLAADQDPQMIRMLRQRSTCHNLPVEYTVHDSLRASGWPGADLVVVDPPFTGSDMTRLGKRQQAARHLFPWLGQAVGQLAPGGQAIVLAPAWLLTRTGEDDPVARLRSSLVEQRILRAVVQLPRLSHPFRTGTELVVLVLTKPVPGEGPQTVLVCNAERTSGDGIEIAHTLRHMLAGTPAPLPPGVARELPRAETSLQRSLLPSHVLATEAQADPGRFADKIAETMQRLSGERVPGPLPTPHVTELSPSRRLITVGEHVAKGRLDVLSGFRVSASEIGLAGDVTVIGEPELAGRAVVGERRVPQGALTHIARVRLTIRDDLVILPLTPLRIIVDEAGGSLVQSPAQIIRILPERSGRSHVWPWMIPSVLAAMLTAPRNRGRASGSRVLRDDLAAMEIPDLPYAEVKRLEDLLRELAAARLQAVRRLAALDELTEALRSGVADGILSVTGDRSVPADTGREHGGAT